MLFYVFVYTIWLKPRSPQNIVIGGAAGAVPVLVGWAAVTNDLAAPAWVLFAVVFLWTPPHFWALSLRYADDYERAGIPMMPVVKGVHRTLVEMAAYSVAVVATSLVLPLVSDVGATYVVAAVVLGALFVTRAVQLVRSYSPARAMQFFTLSNTYLALLFAAVAIDTLVRTV
jgi:protoheme IX farnesyltransferase